MTSTTVPMSIVPETTTGANEFGNMCLIEPMRGCQWACRFCLAGHLYGPPRRKDTQALIAEIAFARALTPKIGLVGPSLSDHPDMAQVMAIQFHKINAMNENLEQRIDERTKDLAESKNGSAIFLNVSISYRSLSTRIPALSSMPTMQQ